MSNLIQAADDARRLLRGFKAFEEVAAALELVGTLEQHKAELTAAIAASQEQLAELGRQNQAAADEVAQAQAKAKRIETDAIDASVRITNTAHAEAEGIRAAAHAAAEEAHANVQSAVQAGQQVLAEAEARFNVVKAETEALEARAAEARAFLAKLAG